MSKKAALKQKPADYQQVFQMLLENKKNLYTMLDRLPFPLEVFSPDGTSIFVNRFFLEMHHIHDPLLCVGKYNIQKDKILKKMGLSEGIKKAFRGETLAAYNINVKPLVQDLLDRGIIEEKPFETIVADFYLIPIINDKKLACVVFTMNIKKLYYGRPDLAQIKEYLDTHWQGRYKPKEVSVAVNMSVSRLYSLFKQYTGMTPGEYHKQCKIDHIKEKLNDKSLSIKEAFATCGEDSQGHMARVFKDITGISPAEWRNNQAV